MARGSVASVLLLLLSPLSVAAQDACTEKRGGVQGLGDALNQAANAPGAKGSPDAAAAAATLAGIARDADAISRKSVANRMDWIRRRPWTDTLHSLRGTPEYAALSPKAKADFDAIGKYLSENPGSVVAATAAANLARLLADGTLATAGGAHATDVLAKMIVNGGDAMKPEAAFLLADKSGTNALLAGAAPVWTTFDFDRTIAVAGPISDSISDKLANSNNPWKPGQRIESTVAYVGATFGDPVNEVRARTEKRIDYTPGASDSMLDARDGAAAYSRVLTEEAISRGWGNCGDNARAAAIMLHDAGVPWVEVLKKDGDSKGDHNHAFVVVGRLLNSNVADPKTWGPNAVVVDPWSGTTPFNVAAAVADGTFDKKLPGVGLINKQFRMPDPVPQAPAKPLFAVPCGSNATRWETTRMPAIAVQAVEPKAQQGGAGFLRK